MRREIAALLIAASAVSPALAGGTVRASCSRGSDMVYREDLPEDAPAERRVTIASSHPDALCVFLTVPDEGEDDGFVPMEAAGAGVRLPGGVVAAAAGRASLDDSSLQAALAAIAGGGSAPAGRPSASRRGDEGGRPLTLTLAVYRGVDVPGVLAHWKEIRRGSRTLARMTPTVSTLGDLSVLSLEGVADSEAAKVCEAADRAGLPCIAAQ